MEFDCICSSSLPFCLLYMLIYYTLSNAVPAQVFGDIIQYYIPQPTSSTSDFAS